MEFKQEKATEEKNLPSSSSFDEILDLIESNNMKDVDDKLTEIYDLEDKDHDLRASAKKGKGGFGFKVPGL